MRRRQVVVGFGAVLAWPVVAQQAAKVPRVGFLWESPKSVPRSAGKLRRGLRDLGWVEGQMLLWSTDGPKDDLIGFTRLRTN